MSLVLVERKAGAAAIVALFGLGRAAAHGARGED